jgi:hypothetical protein
LYQKKFINSLRMMITFTLKWNPLWSISISKESICGQQWILVTDIIGMLRQLISDLAKKNSVVDENTCYWFFNGNFRFCCKICVTRQRKLCNRRPKRFWTVWMII